MCSSTEEKIKRMKDIATVKDRSLMNGVDPKAEPVVGFMEKLRESQKKQKLGGQPTETTQTPAPSPTEVGSLGGATALDRKNKKGISSMTTSNTILGSSKGG